MLYASSHNREMKHNGAQNSKSRIYFINLTFYTLHIYSYWFEYCVEIKLGINVNQYFKAIVGWRLNFANIKFGFEFRVYFYKKYKVAILLFLLLR